ncbi:hypothetical protein [Flavobacterium sp. SORGH_AS_0622]|uniref:hypothetical protein n=1 Tax=Flavobacterium sp. SORGH_AS_0622 TaxID=3041772 RepID=UPI002780FB3F|nr:hypothetical protein [Flavobacterium sp. SORGH_AS_0622]MDQ1164565.1 hypothetical protein [Flavobacterium sp. SORGH_AS_0622]
MSTNHNRIRVADLETNQRNKILKTNEKGELEFSDLNNLQTENYNALDCTTEGKALDARQGKVLKDLVEQSDSNNMKLSGNQTFSGVKTATNTSYPQNAGIVINNTSDNNDSKNIALSSSSGTSLFCDNTKGKGILSQTNSGYAGHFYCYGNGVALYVNSPNSANKTVLITGNTKNDNVNISNAGTGANIKSVSTGTGLVFAGSNGTDTTSTISKEGNITAKTLELSAGTIDKPALVIPNGTFTTTPQNGAIERDAYGKLWTTRNGIRYMLTEDDNSYIKILLNGEQKIIDTPSPYISTNTTQDTLLGSFNSGTLSNSFLGRLTMIANVDNTIFGSGNIPPEISKFQIVIKFKNALLSPNHYGEGYLNELILIDSINKTDTTATLAASHTGWDQNLGMFNEYYVYDSINKSSFKNLADVSVEIVCRNLIEFKDSTNANLKNQAIRSYIKITSTLIERIRK